MYEHGTEIKDIENGRIGEIVKILLYKGSFTSYQTNRIDQTYYILLLLQFHFIIIIIIIILVTDLCNLHFKISVLSKRIFQI